MNRSGKKASRVNVSEPCTELRGFLQALQRGDVARMQSILSRHEGAEFLVQTMESGHRGRLRIQDGVLVMVHRNNRTRLIDGDGVKRVVIPGWQHPLSVPTASSASAH